MENSCWYNFLINLLMVSLWSETPIPTHTELWGDYFLICCWREKIGYRWRKEEMFMSGWVVILRWWSWSERERNYHWKEVIVKLITCCCNKILKKLSGCYYFTSTEDVEGCSSCVFNIGSCSTLHFPQYLWRMVSQSHRLRCGNITGFPVQL